MLSFQNVNFELKYITTDTSVSVTVSRQKLTQNTQKFSQSHTWSQSHIRSESHSRGPRPRGLTKVLQPPSQCPTGADQSQSVTETVSPLRVDPNPRSTNYAHILNQRREGTRP